MNTRNSMMEEASADPMLDLKRQLRALDSIGRLRRMQTAVGTDFSSNDYLGLAAGPELRAAAAQALAQGVAIGSGGSRLLRGNAAEHESLEARAATLWGVEAALFLPSGFAANAMLLSTLPQTGDVIVHDELVHASMHDGLRLARCDAHPARHNDADYFDRVLRRWRQDGGRGRPWLAVESLYSMDGDFAPLADLVAVARAHEGVLLIDEAHAAGVFGPRGCGLAADLTGAPDIITLVTLGKAFGCEGALILSPAVIREFLVNRGRGLIFSTAPSPLMAAIAEQALTLVSNDATRRPRLATLRQYAAKRLARHRPIASTSQIMPLILGDDVLAVRAAAKLRNVGFDVRAVRPPTVAPGTARLRITITLNVGEAEIDALDTALGTALA